MLDEFFSLIAHFVVLLALIGRDVNVSWLRQGIPGYLTRLCWELPQTAENTRLARISRISDISLFFAFLVGVATGMLLGGHHGA